MLKILFEFIGTVFLTMIFNCTLVVVNRGVNPIGYIKPYDMPVGSNIGGDFSKN